MADFKSTHYKYNYEKMTRFGYDYEIGVNFGHTSLTWEPSTIKDPKNKEMYMNIIDNRPDNEKGIEISFYTQVEDKDGDLLMDEISNLSVQEKNRMKLVEYLRQVADMLERNKNIPLNTK